MMLSPLAKKGFQSLGANVAHLQAEAAKMETTRFGNINGDHNAVSSKRKRDDRRGRGASV